MFYFFEQGGQQTNKGKKNNDDSNKSKIDDAAVAVNDAYDDKIRFKSQDNLLESDTFLKNEFLPLYQTVGYILLCLVTPSKHNNCLFK